MRPGDRLELRGPAGSFAWQPALGGPLLLIARGLGVAPSRAILRHRSRVARAVPARLVYEATSLDAVPYRDDLARLAAFDEVDVRLVPTAEPSPRWRGDRGPVDADVVVGAASGPADRALIYVCGDEAFVAAVAGAVRSLGLEASRVRMAITGRGCR